MCGSWPPWEELPVSTLKRNSRLHMNSPVKPIFLTVSKHFKTMSQWYRNSMKSNIYCAIVSTYSSQIPPNLFNFPSKLPSSIFHQTPSAPFQMFFRLRDGRNVRGVPRQVPGDRPSNIGEIQIQIRETRLDGRWEFFMVPFWNGKKIAQNLPYQGVGPGCSYKWGEITPI